MVDIIAWIIWNKLMDLVALMALIILTAISISLLVYITYSINIFIHRRKS